ncbi:glycosyltransferase [Herbiconiux sp. P18]|uniref:glycosyltransferase n=1 Tax=Herbiconiux liangxiaofengii TaxID=3342795 RepID=UPI0035B74940
MSTEPTVLPLVSVIVVNWRQSELTARSVRSLDHPHPGLDVEVVVVDNESTEESLAALEQGCPGAVLVTERENRGFAGGVTAGLRAARGEIIVLLNNDAVALPGFLLSGAGRLLGGPGELAAVAARVDLEGSFSPVADGEPPSSEQLDGLDGTRWRPDPQGTALVNSTGVELGPGANGFDRDWLRPVERLRRTADDHPFAASGAAVFLRRSAVEAVGGFDTSYFMYYEDLDLSWRLRLSGYTIGYEPAARVVHRHAASSSHSSSLIRVNSVRNRWLTVLKNGSVRLVLSVTARTAARLLIDLTRSSLRRDGAFIAPREWRRLLRDAARLAPGAVRARRSGRSVAETRRALERRFIGRSV